MWNRIYFVVIAVCVVVMSALTYYSWSWLQSIGAPRAAVEGYTYHSGIAWNFLWVSSVALLILANVILAKYQKSWAMWASLVYFAVFVVIRYFWLEGSFSQLNHSSGLGEAGMSWAPVTGVIICIAAAAVVIANQFLALRISEKMYPARIESSPDVELSVEARHTDARQD